MIDKNTAAPGPAELLGLAVETAREAGNILRQGFGTSFRISDKAGRHNLVTEYDNAAEEYIIRAIRSRYPEHAFLAEESGASGAEQAATVRWIIDPLDGTVNFAHDIPIFCVSIAAEFRGELLCGAVYQPMLDEMFTACKNGGAFLNEKGISVSSCAKIDDAILVTGFPYNVHRNPGNCIDHFVHFVRQGLPVRRLGSAALDLCYTAAGRFDAFWEVALHPWDVAAGALIVRQAGGRLSHYDGSEHGFGQASVVASNGHIHDAMLQIIGQADRNPVL